MKKLSLNDLQALRGAGGTVTVGGRPMQPVEVPAQPSAQQPMPALVSEAEARRLIDESDAVWRDLIESMQRQIDLLTSQVQLQAQRKAVPWRLKASYLADGSIDQLVATPAATVH